MRRSPEKRNFFSGGATHEIHAKVVAWMLHSLIRKMGNTPKTMSDAQAGTSPGPTLTFETVISLLLTMSETALEGAHRTVPNSEKTPRPAFVQQRQSASSALETLFTASRPAGPEKTFRGYRLRQQMVVVKSLPTADPAPTGRHTQAAWLEPLAHECAF